MDLGPPIWYSELSIPRLLFKVLVAWPNVGCPKAGLINPKLG